MNTIYFDSTLEDVARRKKVYEGQIFVFSPPKAALAFCEFARDMIQEAFGGLDPTTAQFHLPMERFVNILAQLKPKFVRHPESRQFVAAMLEELGCDLSKTYLDVPRLKSVPHGQDHRSGLTYAIHPHRDTWYSAPFCQLNWWFPIYDIESESALAFHPEYWSRPIMNGSSKFNHYHWNKYGRKAGATDIEQYIQEQPCPEEPLNLERQIRILCRAGGPIFFSGAQLHSAVPNASGRTRFSVDFRTVHIDDVIAKTGAPNIDSACTGTSLRDFLRGTDLSPIPDSVIRGYDLEPVTDGELVFQPPPLERV